MTYTVGESIVHKLIVDQCEVWSCVEESPVGTHSAEHLPTALTTAVGSLLDVDSCLWLISLIDSKSPKGCQWQSYARKT